MRKCYILYLYTHIIVILQEPLVKPLVHVINSSVVWGISPFELKFAKEVPIYKKEEITKTTNMPSIINYFSNNKIYHNHEKVAYNR